MMFSGLHVNAQNFGLAGSTAEEMISIPPLRMLIDSAKQYSPLLKTKDIEIAIKEIQWRVQRWEWADYIRPFTEYRYGSIDNYLLVGGSLLPGPQSIASRFSIGAQINLTIFDAINYRSKLKLADKQIELDLARREEIELLITQEIINLYSQLITYRKIIFIKSDHMITQALNLDEAQLRYESGEVPIVELARIREIATKSEEGFELAKMEFRRAILLLSELVGQGDDITTWIIK